MEEGLFFSQGGRCIFFFKAQKKNTSSLFENYYTLDKSEFALFFFLQENVRDGGGKVSPIRSIARRSSSR